MIALKSILPVVLAATVTLPLAAQDVGYYDMSVGQGNASQVPSITAAGGNPVLISDLSPAELGTIDVLYVQNPSNGSFGSEYLSNLPNVEAAVNSGLVLVIHDRYVTSANTILPGGGSFSAVRLLSNDIDFTTFSTTVSNGPAGVLDNASLDGGGSSSHGYLDAATLPAGAENVLHQAGSPNQIVTTAYSHGSGTVIYSSIPLDHFLAGFGSVLEFPNVYAPNVVAYAMEFTQNVELAVTGTCPGPATFSITGASALTPVAFIYGAPGLFTVPGGACAGLDVAIASPQVAFVVFADLVGGINLPLTLPPAACGATIQAVDMTACAVSNAVVL
jgi:hypothetical protein